MRAVATVDMHMHKPSHTYVFAHTTNSRALTQQDFDAALTFDYRLDSMMIAHADIMNGRHLEVTLNTF